MRLRFGEEVKDRVWQGDKPVILTFWHSQLLMTALGYCGARAPGTRLKMLVSQSRDGELISRIINQWGIDSIRGSSSKGGRAAFTELLRALRNNEHIGITPDGPKGPARKVKHGVLKLSQMSGSPIIPFGWQAKSFYTFNSWDKMRAPMPFSKLLFQMGTPMIVPSDATESELKELAEQLEQELNRIST